MTADLAVGPVKHRVDPDVAWGPAHPKLLLDEESVKGSLDDGLDNPIVIVGDDEILPHDGLRRLDLRIVPSEAHGLYRESRAMEFVADMKLFTDLVITGGNGFRLSPLRFPVAELLPE